MKSIKGNYIMDKVNRPEKPKKDDLKKLYDVCNSIFKNKQCFYTPDEFKQIKKEKEEIC